ncbi:MAG: hypothetical protein ACOCZ5_01230 [bacterium]
MLIKNDVDIKICTPYYNNICEETRDSIYGLLDSDRLNCAWLYHRGTAIATNRNFLINEGKSDLEFQKIDDSFSHYLFIDSDIVVTVNDVEKLLEYDFDIISASYIDRDNNDCYVGGHFLKDINNIINGVNKLSIFHRGILEVDWVGGGCLLVKKKVFETLPFPWFRHTILNKYKNGNKHCLMVHEDVGFSLLAKQYGYKIYLDCNIKVDHLSSKEFRELNEFF